MVAAIIFHKYNSTCSHLILCPSCSVRHYHCLKKMEKGQPQNSVPVHLCFGITKDAINEDLSDQKELCPCWERQRLNYWRNRSFSLTSKGRKRAPLTQKATFFSLLVGKVTALLNFCDVPGALQGDHSHEILLCSHRNVPSSQSLSSSRLLF